MTSMGLVWRSFIVWERRNDKDRRVAPQLECAAGWQGILLSDVDGEEW